MLRAFAELSEKGDRIDVHFNYDPVAVDAIKRISGARFISKEKGGPFWRLPLDLQVAHRLREEFGQGLELGEAIKEWGRAAVTDQRKLLKMAVSDDVPVEELKLHTKLPEMAAWLRPYQRADVAFLGTTSALNLNQPRLGKTAETIAQAFEADLEHGPHLVVAPQKALDSVWRMEIERWTGMKVYTLSGDTKKADRVMPDEVPEEAFWYVTTADMIRREIARFEKVEWNTFTVDEYHKTGLLRSAGTNDPKKNSVFTLACRRIKSKRRYAMSGTPIGGRAIKLWNGLNFVHPQVFTSKWRWAEEWLEVEDKDGHPDPHGIAEGKEDAFYKAHASYIVRRLRSEVLPQLPPKLAIPVWCDMTTKQRKMYDSFAEDLEIRIDEQRVAAANVLVEYTRLKQFANSVCTVEPTGAYNDEGEATYRVLPTDDSNKLPYLLERLAEEGIDPEDPVGTTQAIVASQFRSYVEMISKYLTEKGIANVKLTGKATKAESERAQRAFKAGNDNEGLRVVCMVTTMGVGLTLDNVTSVHLMDETWIPDDQEQLSDRAINTTRNHQVSVLTYRSRGTIEEGIYKTNVFRALSNADILDLRRQGFRATMKGV